MNYGTPIVAIVDYVFNTEQLDPKMLNATVLSSATSSPAISYIGYVSNMPTLTVGNISTLPPLGGYIEYDTQLFNSTAVASGSAFYTPHRRKISLTVHVTAVSGTSSTLDIYMYGIDPFGNVLTSDAVAHLNQILGVGDAIGNIDLYGINSTQVTWVLGGTSSAYTMAIGIEE